VDLFSRRSDRPEPGRQIGPGEALGQQALDLELGLVRRGG